MRWAIPLAVAVIVAACAVEQSSSEHAFLQGDGARAAQAALDAEAILQGMAQARDENQRLARVIRQTEPEVAPPALTR
jgi:outer membrane PBP1 activator LpoA protein